MSFLNPMMLFGLGAVAVPIVIHLLNRRKFQKVVWGAMRFIKTSIEHTRRRSRIEDMLLLLLRCLLIALLALALARPALKSTGMAVLGGPSKSTAVILLDNSMSMSLSDGAETSFDRALKAGDQIAGSLANGSSAALLLISDTIRAVIPEPTYDLNLVRKMIREATLSDRGTDLLPGVATAVETLKRRPDLGKEIYLITDGQAEGWRHFGEIQQLLQKSKDIRAHVVLVGSSDDRNLAINALSLISGLSPVGQPVRFEVQVKNWGRDSVRDVHVALSVDSDPAGDEFTIDVIPPGATRNVSLFAKLRQEGFHTISASIPDDRLKTDNKRSMVVHAFKEIRVLLVDGAPGAEPRESETFFLRHALQPVARGETANYFIKPTVITATGLGAIHYNDFDAVVLANVPTVPADAVDSLDSYLQTGGGLIFFPGDRTDAGFYNRQFGAREILPALFGVAHGDLENEDKFFHFQEKNFDHPVTAIWSDPAAGTLSSARFFRAVELMPANTAPNAPIKATNGVAQTAGPARVVLRYSDGKPALMERTYGLGQVFLFSSSAGTAWNDFPVRPAFVPLLHRILGSILQRHHDGLTVKVGEPLIHRTPVELLGKEAVIYKPGSRQEGRDFRSIEMLNGWPTLHFDATDSAGRYDVSIPGSPARLIFAAQTDPNESNLQQLNAAELKTLDAVAHLVRWSPALSLTDRKDTKVAGVELWLPFLLAALIAAAIETFLSYWFSRPK